MIVVTGDYYWAKVKHNGQIEIVEVLVTPDQTIISRIGDEQTLDLDQVELLEPVAAMKRATV